MVLAVSSASGQQVELSAKRPPVKDVSDVSATETLLGRTPTTLQDYLAEHRDRLLKTLKR